jgi:regulator of CtrA degradation
MNQSNINGRLIEGLYCEALVLSDEVRAHFDLSRRHAAMTPDHDHSEDEAQIALSCEALRATTRMMHATAWLLNHRAFLTGQLGELRLRTHGKLPPELPAADSARTAILPQGIAELIRATEEFYARLQRIDRRLHGPAADHPRGIDLIRARLGWPAAA